MFILRGIGFFSTSGWHLNYLLFSLFTILPDALCIINPRPLQQDFQFISVSSVNSLPVNYLMMPLMENS